ncbi:MAG: PTS fructose transporter subunit IIA [Betaproteobacteria bacterium]|nr:PTS fructose transporter subunit IIA [Betaproteobacteria bacterium]
MIGVLIIAHEDLGDALIRCVTHVLGSRPALFESLTIGSHDEAFKLLPQARKLVAALDDGEGVLILSDIYGATPCNLACKLLVPGRVEVVTGVSLPMVVRAFTYRDKGLAMMVSKAVSGGRDGVLHVEPSPLHATART